MNFLQKIAESDLAVTLDEMGYDESYLIKWQKKRLIKALAVVLASAFFSAFFFSWILPIGIGLAVFVWLSEYKRVKKVYFRFKFEKNLAFARFMRMLIPYLLQTGATVYGAFNSMLNRLDDGHVKDALRRLLIEMNQEPNSEMPFRRFAMDASGTDQAILFMTTLYDYQQSSNDTSIIRELGKMATEQLFEGINEIVEFKLKKFIMFPTKLVMTSFLLVLGYAIAVITDVISSINLE